MSSTRPASVCGVLGGALLLLAAERPLEAQPQRCSEQDLRAVLQSTDKEYAAAMELAQVLQTGGLGVNCVLRSHMTGLFEGLEGAALYRTDQGDVEAIFLPRAETFESLTVIERPEGGRYVYSFQGPPQPTLPNRIDSMRRVYFVKHAQHLLQVGDEGLAGRLGRIVGGEPRR